MRFSKLRLTGFKSFVEPMEFIIESGLTGVVGPNGCGKSNLVEALRWVMGESSYKNMRASGMDDVIFSGSATRPSRNTAEVALFLDNTDRSAPAAYNDSEELQVARRIEREAGSAYKINGKDARAKDVQLLFADQSTGARSPSMVGQGRIGELIQAKPQARRALLEEAAGISGLHSRRHEAELRLRAAEQNLERLDDVVGELETQIESLKRQARQATRFKNVSAEIRKSEAVVLHLRWAQAKTLEAELNSALSSATATVGERAEFQVNAAKEQAIAATRLPELRDAEARAAAALQRLTIARAHIDEEAERLGARKRELAGRIEQLDADIKREEQMVRDNAEVLARLNTEEKTLVEETAAASDQESGSRAAFEAASSKLTRSEAGFQKLTGENAEAVAARAQIERAIHDAVERRDKTERQLTGINREAEEIALKIAALADPAEKSLQVDSAEATVLNTEEAALAAEQAVEAARAREATLRSPVDEARAALNRIEAEAQTLAKILNADAADLFPAVVEKVKVESGFETALGAALGEDLDIPIDHNAPVHWRQIAMQPSDPKLPGNIRPLSDVVRAPAELSRRLAQIGIVENDDGPELQKQLLPGQRLVSPDGDLWRWDGYTASAEAPTAAAQRLAQKNRLSELDREVVAVTRTLRETEDSLAGAQQSVADAAEAQRIARETWRQAQTDLTGAREALSKAERDAGEFASRRAALDEARGRLEENLNEAIAALAEAETASGSAPDLEMLQQSLERLGKDVSEDRALLAETRAAHDGLKREAEARERRIKTIGTERQSWTARAQNADRQIAALGQRRSEAQKELDGVAAAPEELETKRKALLSQLSEAEHLRKEAADRLAEAESRQSELDKLAQDAIQALSQAREERARTEERGTAAEERRKEAEARIREALNCAPHLAFNHTGLSADDAMPDMDPTERRLEKLKMERERLGAVNLRAEEEQAELTGRLETILSEHQDVIDAIGKLRQAIQSLNREGRERLLVAFDEVNEQFKRLFAHLFGGGTAELQLVESEDPLEAGLEILARPPGKKPQTMTLLSGGEQALTAMALIFAVFLTNPAPICVLDEVDAPLDDHNVERFCNLMDEMAVSTETRFVIITHNPITMARMNRLFGVTMAEQGVSQLVSVNLDTAEQLREAS